MDTGKLRLRDKAWSLQEGNYLNYFLRKLIYLFVLNLFKFIFIYHSHNSVSKNVKGKESLIHSDDQETMVLFF